MVMMLMLMGVCHRLGLCNDNRHFPIFLTQRSFLANYFSQLQNNFSDKFLFDLNFLISFSNKLYVMPFFSSQITSGGWKRNSFSGRKIFSTGVELYCKKAILILPQIFALGNWINTPAIISSAAVPLWAPKPVYCTSTGASTSYKQYLFLKAGLLLEKISALPPGHAQLSHWRSSPRLPIFSPAHIFSPLALLPLLLPRLWWPRLLKRGCLLICSPAWARRAADCETHLQSKQVQSACRPGIIWKYWNCI